MKLLKDTIYTYRELAEFIAKESSEKGFRLLGITGTSSVGKSTFTSMLENELKKAGKSVLVLRMDDYLKKEYRSGTRFWNRKDSTYLKPEYFDWEEVCCDIKKLQAGNAFEKECYIRGDGWGQIRSFEAADCLILEGLFLDSMSAAACMEYDWLISLVADDKFIRKLRTERDAYYRAKYKNFQRTEAETQAEIDNTLLAGKAYEVCKDKWNYIRLHALGDFNAKI